MNTRCHIHGRSSLIAFVLLLFAVPSAPADDRLPPDVAVFRFDHVRRVDFVNALETMGLEVEETSSIAGQEVMRFKNQASADVARRLYRQVNVAPKRIRIHFQLFFASLRQTAPDSSRTPFEDERLTDQLSEVFRFQKYYLIGEALVIANSGGRVTMNIEGLPMFRDGQVRVIDGTAMHYNYWVVMTPHFIEEGDRVIEMGDNVSFVEKGDGIIKLESIRISKLVPAEVFRELKEAGAVDPPPWALLNATLNVRNGERVILGTSDLEGKKLIMIVQAETLEIVPATAWLGFRVTADDLVPMRMGRCGVPVATKALRDVFRPAFFRFENRSQDPIKLSRAGTDRGQAVPRVRVVEPGGAHEQQAFVGRPWLLTDLSGECLGMIIPPPEPALVVYPK